MMRVMYRETFRLQAKTGSPSTNVLGRFTYKKEKEYIS